ncbi:MAG: hypothetical protein E7249_01845 [Paenibacillaceae bacterium]|nr:hypothetical protein [Paenibacillaceae bacterium]
MIKYFTVYGLFGKFKNEIVFNEKEKITLLIGPNGCGKTTTLKILKCVFMDTLKELWRFDFEKIEIGIENSIIRIETDKEYPYLQKKMNRNNKTFSIHGVFKIFLNDKPMEYVYSRNTDKYLERNYIKNHYYEDEISEITKFNPYIERSIIKEEYNDTSAAIELNFPEEIKVLLEKVKIDFVSTNRLLKMDIDENIPLRELRNRFRYENMVEVYSNELVKMIKDTLSEYANISQKLDEAFPGKIFEALKNNIYYDEDKELVEKKIEEINTLREKHIKTGILESNETTKYITDSIDTVDSKTLPILKVYYKDTEEKLKSLNDLSDRILLFIDLVNRKLMYGKQLIITKEKGIQITDEKGIQITEEKGIQITKEKGIQITDRKKIIELSQLSSGEQQEIVLLYRLIFSSNENQLILIDEPEISLHVAWQRQFVDDLKKIIELNKMNILIATHSPQILNDYWNLTVKLGEVE